MFSIVQYSTVLYCNFVIFIFNLKYYNNCYNFYILLSVINFISRLQEFKNVTMVVLLLLFLYCRFYFIISIEKTYGSCCNFFSSMYISKYILLFHLKKVITVVVIFLIYFAISLKKLQQLL